MNEWARKIRKGDARALARAATAVENGAPEARDLLAALAPYSGHARIIGITGPPGAGKSTLVDALARSIRARGETVAVIAVDPSSRASGGAILGDRIRMQDHHADPGVFIRSMATRGQMGGLARATAEMARLMDAAGRDWVLLETVGVGQDEIEIASVADTTVVMLIPGMGDDVQALKAGILEIADVFVVNKADRPGADTVEQELETMLDLAGGGRRPPVIRTVATQGMGISELLDRAERHAQTAARREASISVRRAEFESGNRNHRRQRASTPCPEFEAQEEISIETPFGRPSDNYVVGRLGGKQVAFLARHGRGHRISPSELNFRANIYGMKSLGVERIVSLSAVGSLKEEHRPLDFVIPDQFFDRTRGRVSHVLRRGAGGSYRVCRPDLPGSGGRGGRGGARSRRQREEGRHVPLHGRPGVLH